MPKKIPLWFVFSLETQSSCNLRCPNCMRNTEPTRSRFRNGEPIKEEMPTERVHDLINQASELGYRGGIVFSYYSEPTCEPRLVSFVKYAKKKGVLPWIISNGVLLTDELCKQLDGIVDRVGIGLANTSKDGRRKPPEFWRTRFPKTRKLNITTEGYKPSKWWPTHFFPQTERLQAAIRKNINTPCHIPRKYLIIQYDGEMSLCCDDLSHVWNLGNAFEKSLEELWWSEKHVEILKTLSVAGGRLKYPYCRICPVRNINLETNYKAWYKGTSYIRVRPRYGDDYRTHEGNRVLV